MKKWLKKPAPGQFWGEGEWVEINEKSSNQDQYDYYYSQKTGFLPVHQGEYPPNN